MPFTKGHKLWMHPNCRKTQFKKGGAHHAMPHTPEARRKMSLSRIGKTLGTKNPSWKGGITPLLNKIKRLTEYKEWQRKVMERDNHTCRKCGNRGGDKTAHHLTAFSFLIRVFKIRTVQDARDCFWIWNIRNGVTLCIPCHEQTSNFAWRAAQHPKDREYYPVLGALLLCLAFLLPSYSEAATFGYDTEGGSSLLMTGSRAYGAVDTLSEDGDVSKITGYLRDVNGSDAQAAFYDSSLDFVNNTGTENPNSGDSWYDFTFSPAETLSASDYWIMVWSTGGSGTASRSNIAYDGVGTNIGRDTESSTFPNWPDPTGEEPEPRRYSTYATYTASGGGATPTPTDTGVLFDWE